MPCGSSKFLAFLVGLLAASTVQAQNQAYTARFDLTLPSALPSGNKIDDTIYFNLYLPKTSKSKLIPVVIAIDGLDFVGVRGDINPITDPFGRYAASHGVAAISISLPWEMLRMPPGDKPIKHYLSLDPKVSVQAFSQAISDVRTVADWLKSQPGIDSTKIGLVGISLGSIVANDLMGIDPSFKAGVTILNMGDFFDYYERGPLTKFSRFYHWGMPVSTGQALKDLAKVDPLTYAKDNRPRHVLMIQADRDMIFPPHYGTELWKALGRPPFRWIDTNHIAPGMVQGELSRRSLEYLEAVWSDPNYNGRDFPQLWAPTLKVGFVYQWRAVPAFAAQFEVLTLGRLPNRLPLFNANLGLGTNGPFADVAVTLGQHIDFGWMQHLPIGRAGPYLSFHFVF